MCCCVPLNCTNEQKYTNLVANVGDNVVLTVKRRKNKKNIQIKQHMSNDQNLLK